ncbi:hypothetical protein D1B33_03680 [Lysinibacillus yapensis]|uniref:Copper amine oxidase-like N-terminal domain-containing protein n=1 Tax=Ureibacillus yapensis TaxID=2304605 RepID=A0A396SKR8_9BACL|nr:stalk domain-containing protein [Lysinibacillus yapensis]RHW39959.1 hypothetical protein D1B33_03680 [Lysinibacillus yapensis]
MYRFLSLSCAFFVACFLTFHSDASAATKVGKNLYVKNDVEIIINGETIKFNDPILNQSGSTLLPMRDFYEAIGATVTWSKQSQTATSYKNGRSVALTIDSKRALVDGTSVTMNVAPIMYKYRTYVPLRFVSENLDGQVIWNQAAQSVTINLTDSDDGTGSETPPVTETPKVDYILHMNSTKLIMDKPFINRNGRLYIPAKYFENYLENAYSLWLSEDVMELQVASTNFMFTNGSNEIYVDGIPLTVSEKPFIQSGEMYVPVNLIVNSLENGGSVRYYRDNNELYVYINDYLFSSQILGKQYGSLMVPQFVPSASYEGERTLIVSDNPENLTPSLVPTDTATLSEYKVDTNNALKEYRIFGWHVNNLENAATIGITVQNTSENATLRIVNSEGVSKVNRQTAIKYDIGVPIADVVLNDNFKASDSKGITIAPGETKVIEAYQLAQGNIVGFLHDLDIQASNSEKAQYTIRTVINKVDDQLTAIHSDPVPIDPYNAHPRGVWPGSTIKAELPTYTMDTPMVGYNISNGKTDHLQTAENSLSTVNGAVGNPGHFGVTYKVDIPIANPSGSFKTVKLKIAGRGGSYSGVVKMNDKVFIVPTIKVGTEYVELPEYLVTGATDTIHLEFMHAGGSNLPVAVYIETK